MALCRAGRGLGALWSLVVSQRRKGEGAGAACRGWEGTEKGVLRGMGEYDWQYVNCEGLKMQVL